jgi:phosphoribosylamine-glycine ligase
MVLGVGSFAQSAAQILKEDGAAVSTFLTRDHGHYAPALAGPVFTRQNVPSPCLLFQRQKVDVVLPQSIDWAQAPWAPELLRLGMPVFGPTRAAMRIERERDFARQLCAQFGVPFPQAHLANNRLEAEELLARHPRPYVIKNPLCSPASPIHTILCESVEDTRAWLRRIDYAEGVFLQEYLPGAEAGHIALVSGGEIYSMVTNQEYKRAFDGNMGIVAGAPLGGLVERDENDKYGLARALIHPLRAWLRKEKFNGPLQVTAINREGVWRVIEYNVRIGVTSGPMILRMLSNPLETVVNTARNKKLQPRFRDGLAFGCSVTLAGYGYPFSQVRSPHLPLRVSGEFDCDVWWNEVAQAPGGDLMAVGQRVADVVALAPTLQAALHKAYANIRRIRLSAGYYRTDIGQSLWPPGQA